MNFIDLKDGKSVEGAAIKAFRSEIKASKYIYLMAGVHGDEVEGVYVLQNLIEWLREQDDIELPLIIIPILNVDGYRAGTRVNAHGVDLNRNLPAKSWIPEYKEDKYNPGPEALSEPENKYLVKLFQKYPPKFILTFHSWVPMVNYNGDCKEIAELLGRHNSYEVTTDVGYPTPGSLGDYGPNELQTPVITFECPVLADGKTLKEIWEENKAGLENLLKSNLLKN